MAATLNPAEPTLSSNSSNGIVDPLDALLTTAAIASLDATAWVRVTGPDRVRWLNGMVTNSIHDLAPGQGCYNFVLNAQGRIQGDLTAFVPDSDPPDSLLLETSADQVHHLIALLDRFIIMDDVELTDISSERTGLAVIGPRAASILEHVGLPVHLLAPDPLHMTMQSSSWRGTSVCTLQQYSPLVPRFELWAEPAVTELAREALLTAGAIPATPAAQEHLRILEGTPRYGTDIRNSETARDLPQETAQTRALHFAKGCYLGQEIVERIRSRGAVHRTFTGFELTGALPPPGTALTDASGKAVAELTSVTAIPWANSVGDGKPIPLQLALGYIRREALAAQTTLLHYPGGTAAPISLPALPIKPAEKERL
jgi:folate-binding protein YgfZ